MLMYELLTGDPPFQGANLQGVYTSIVNLPHAKLMSQLRKSGVSAGAQALIIGLLNRNPAERLGSGPDDSMEIRQHPYFAGDDALDWDAVLRKEVEPGYAPTVSDELDTTNFDHLFTRDKHLESVHLPGKDEVGKAAGDDVFDGFTYMEGTMMSGGGSPRLDGLDDDM